MSLLFSLLYQFKLFTCSGFATDNIIKVLQGEMKGTLFHKDAHLWTLVKEVSAREMAISARESSRRLQVMKGVNLCYINTSLTCVWFGLMFCYLCVISGSEI